MLFELEDMTPERIEKVLRDSAVNNDLQIRFQVAVKVAQFPSQWAHCAAHDAYLIDIPDLVENRSFDREFCIFFNGRPHTFTLIGWCGERIRFGQGLPQGAEYQAFLQALLKAFAVRKDWEFFACGRAELPQIDGAEPDELVGLTV